MSLWVAAFLLSMSWLYSIRLYVNPSVWPAAILTVAGLAVMAIAMRRKVDFSKMNPLWPLLAIPAAAALITLGFPASVGLAIITAGLIALALCRCFPKLSAVAASLLIGGVILTLQSLIVPLYLDYVTTHLRAPLISTPVHAILNWLGLRTSLSGGDIYIQTMRNNWRFPATWGALGLFPLLQMFAAAAVILPLFGGEPKQGRRALWTFIVGLAYIIIRYVFMLLLFVYLMYHVDYFDNHNWIC